MSFSISFLKKFAFGINKTAAEFCPIAVKMKFLTECLLNPFNKEFAKLEAVLRLTYRKLECTVYET